MSDSNSASQRKLLDGERSVTVAPAGLTVRLDWALVPVAGADKSAF